jgi:hypothetical protein
MGWPLIWPRHPPAKLNNSRQNHRAYGRFLKSWLVESLDGRGAITNPLVRKNG